MIQELGADRHPVTKLGETALHLACAGGHTELVSTLWQIFDLEVNATDNDGRTPLHHASLRGHADTVAALITEQRAFWMRIADQHRLYNNRILDINTADKRGDTPLHAASKRGCAATVAARGGQGVPALAQVAERYNAARAELLRGFARLLPTAPDPASFPFVSSHLRGSGVVVDLSDEDASEHKGAAPPSKRPKCRAS